MPVEEHVERGLDKVSALVAIFGLDAVEDEEVGGGARDVGDARLSPPPLFLGDVDAINEREAAAVSR